jgi:hypothetical protein
VDLTGQCDLMKLTTTRRVDRWLGIPVCMLLTLWRKLVGPGRAILGTSTPQRVFFVKLAEPGSTALAYSALGRAANMVGYTIRRGKKRTGQRTEPHRFRWSGPLLWLLPAVCGLFLLTFRLSDVAGLHRDEATLGLFAERIQEGLRPVRGYFNIYTAPIHSYIIALFFSLFGKSIWSLRINGVLLNSLAVWAYVDLVRRITPPQAGSTQQHRPIASTKALSGVESGPPKPPKQARKAKHSAFCAQDTPSTPLWAFWFLVTSPAFTVMARIATENYALNPLFLFGGMWAFYNLGQRARAMCTSRIGWSLAGLLFCLGIWNHVIFLPTIAAVAATYLFFARPKFREILRIIPWFIMGGLIGAIPKVYGVMRLGYDFFPASAGTAIPPFSQALLNFVYTLGGDALYIRACGEVRLSLNWALPLAVVISASMLMRRRLPERQRKMWLAVAACLTLSFLGSWLITPEGLIGSRIWLLPLWFVPALLALALPHSPRWLRTGLGCTLIVVNLASVGTNYFYSFLQNGGTPKEEVYVGGRNDNSWDFVDLRPLIKKIQDNNNEPIFIEDFNSDRLRFLIAEPSRRRVHTLSEVEGAKGIPIGSLLALYRLPNRMFPPVVQIGQITALKRQDLSVVNYQVYEVSGTH